MTLIMNQPHLSFSSSTLLHRNGFDTTNFSAGNEIVGSQLSDDSLGKISSSLPKDKKFVVKAKHFSHHKNKYEDQSSFYLLFSSELNALCVLAGEKMKYSDLSRDVMTNLYYFGLKTHSTKMVILLNRKNKDFVKILQGIMTVGFKTSSDNQRFSYENVDYKVMTMEISKKHDEIQEIDF